MTHELAKKLKEAGFHQRFKESDFGCANDEFIKAPTLSELIEACGKTIENECGYDKFLLWFDDILGNPQWHAGYYKFGSEIYVDDYPYPNTTGETPEIAVANLWLELNEI